MTRKKVNCIANQIPGFLNGPLFTLKWDLFETQATSDNRHLAFCMLWFDPFVQNQALHFTVRDETVRYSSCDTANKPRKQLSYVHKKNITECIRITLK